MTKNYVALHTHSDYSQLDGFGKIDEYIQVAKDLGMIGIGLSDHGTASGLYKFITKAQKAGIIPVPGVEFYLAPENPEGAKVQKAVYYGEDGNRAPKYDISNGAYTHLTIFAYNNIGLENLFKLTSISWKPENFYFKPRIDMGMIAEHSEGLIVTSGCPGSEINKRFLLGQDDKAYEFASRLKSIFGENLYIELMDHKMPDDELERILVPKQIKLSRDLDIPLIATNDSHYAYREDAEPHERILAVSTKSTMSELPRHNGGNRFAFSTQEYHIKTYEEMREIFTDEIGKEALANTEKLAKKCEGIKLEYDPHLRPEIEIPEGFTPPTYFQKLIYEGFLKKRGNAPKEIQEESIRRIQEEFQVIHSNDFITYFLVVHDYIDYAHRNGIGIGAGRGSVGGSEIAYVLDISNTDPIRFDLLFERFLSPGRGSLYQIDYVSGESEEIAVSDKKCIYSEDGTDKVIYVHELTPGNLVNFKDGKEVIKNVFVKQPGSAPDVDTDFHTEGREQVVQYCVDKYGEDNVANIITFGTFKAKRAFKAMCTINNVPFALANKASSYIPGMQGAEASLEEITNPSSPRYNEGIDFRKAIENPIFNDVVDIARRLDGRISETGVHPCGVVISSKPLAGLIPLQVRQTDGKVVTQWEYPELEALGLIKMDFLGLELIDTVEQTLENLKLTNESADKPKYIRPIPVMQELIDGPMDDVATYKNLQEGNTVGIFQLGSPGVRDLLRRAKPNNFMDIATITALYRPGPMSMQSHNEWADRKSGAKEVVSIDKDLNDTIVGDILKDTAGVLVYQESLMQIASRYSGMSPYESDLLRKAMGKKNIDLMMSLKPKFIQGAIDNNSTKDLAHKVWETMEGFASYGFNKSHSVSYAINIYQSIYLKTHYPNEFMAALIQQGFGDPEKVRTYIQEAKRMKLKLGPVNINNSQVKMASTGINPSNEHDIVFGFSGVKQISDTFSNFIVKERNANGSFTSVADFIKRMAKYSITASPIANLALAGAFDEFGISRKLVSEKASLLVDSGKKQESKGLSLFDMMGSNESDITGSIEIEGEDFTFNEMIKKEAETIGMFVSGHPTSRLGHIAKIYNPTMITQIQSSKTYKDSYTVLGTITQLTSKTNKSGNRSIAVMIDDGTNAVTSYLPRDVVEGIEKYEELERIARAKEKGELDKIKHSDKMLALLNNDDIEPIESIELNSPYVFTVRTRRQGDNIALGILTVNKLFPAKDGSLPFEIKIENKDMLTKVYQVIKKHKDDNGAYVRIHSENSYSDLDVRVKLSLDFIMDMEKAIGKGNVITEGI